MSETTNTTSNTVTTRVKRKRNQIDDILEANEEIEKLKKLRNDLRYNHAKCFTFIEKAAKFLLDDDNDIVIITSTNGDRTLYEDVTRKIRQKMIYAHNKAAYLLKEVMEIDDKIKENGI